LANLLKDKDAKPRT